MISATAAPLRYLRAPTIWLPDRTWVPYGTLGAGLLWTSLDVTEIDRVFNFQIFYGAGLRQVKRRGPGLMIELRNHYISNAGREVTTSV